MKKGLLVMHYGTPANMDQVEPYYTHIRRGRPPSPEQLEDLLRRYRAIGGPSPLNEVSQQQAELIRKGLERRGHQVELHLAAKHAPPFIGDAVRQMVEHGVETAAGVVLAPHFSSLSVGSYRDFANQAVAEENSSLKLRFVERWGTLPELIDAFAHRIETQLNGWDKAETLVIFTAHSLPSRILAEGDPYKDELLATARLVAVRAGTPRWTFAFQSASGTGEPWLGPDVLEVLEEIAHEGPGRQVVICTIGFVSNHLETLYDLEIEARERSSTLGVQLRVAACINADERVMDALAGLAASLL